MINIMKSEFYKIKHTWIPWVHVMLPIFYAIIFYEAYHKTALQNFDDISIIENYLVCIGLAVPMISGIMSSKIVDMEIGAGNFHVLLTTTKKRSQAYCGKLFLLFFGLFLSINLAVILFWLLFGRQIFALLFLGAIIMVIGSLCTYMIHLWFAIAFGGGASIALGFMETLIALLSLTLLGDKIWYFLPCTWSSRLPATFFLGSKTGDMSIFYGEILKWSYSGMSLTIVVFIFSLIWFSKWDVKSFAE